nr:retrovirus-related Pol polyprotein from transposon TNT 1-94 [Tanacetum cinerariifolium]
MEDEIFFNQSKYIKEMLKRFGLEDSKPTKTSMSTEIKLTKDDEADFMDSTKYQGRHQNTKQYQQDYQKTLAYGPKIYNDPKMSEQLKDIYRALESRYVHEGRTIDPSFYQDLNDESLAKFTNIGFDCILSLDEQICPSEERQNKRTPSPSPIGKSLSPPNAPSKSTSSRSTYKTSSSSPSHSPTPTHVDPPPKLRIVIQMKLEPQELSPQTLSPHDPYVSTMDN